MSEDRFWSLVEGTASGGAEQQVDAVRARLAALSTDELVAYDKRLIDLSNGILTWRHLGAAEVIMGFTSDDVFTDFRTWVVFQGRDVYTAFRADPDSLAAHGPDDDDEELGAAEFLEFLAGEMYEERTGEQIYERPDYPSYVDPAGEQIEHSNAALARLYPKLAARYMRGVDPNGHPSDGPRPIS
jgi:hypothetical protein